MVPATAHRRIASGGWGLGDLARPISAPALYIPGRGHTAGVVGSCAQVLKGHGRWRIWKFTPTLRITASAQRAGVVTASTQPAKGAARRCAGDLVVQVVTPTYDRALGGQGAAEVAPSHSLHKMPSADDHLVLCSNRDSTGCPVIRGDQAINGVTIAKAASQGGATTCAHAVQEPLDGGVVRVPRVNIREIPDALKVVVYTCCVGVAIAVCVRSALDLNVVGSWLGVIDEEVGAADWGAVDPAVVRGDRAAD